MEKISSSPLLVYMFDITETTPAALTKEIEELKNNLEASSFKMILAGNKSDGHDESKLRKEFSALEDVLFISAKDKTNISSLTKKLVDAINLSERTQDNAIVTNARHVEALQHTKESLENVLSGLEKKLSGDLISSDIRNALYHLGLITGEVTTDMLLENIFGKFCIGK